MTFKVSAISLSALLLIVGAGGCQNCKECDSGMKSENTMMAKGDIIDVATGPGMSRVTTLVQAVQAAELVQTL